MIAWIRREFGRRMPQVFPAVPSHQADIMAERRIKRALIVASVAIACLIGVFALLMG
tara:strand:- start:2689 stop:2859 length:171 start_codon:yes stop_codon:yes gene_type:complete